MKSEDGDAISCLPGVSEPKNCSDSKCVWIRILIGLDVGERAKFKLVKIRLTSENLRELLATVGRVAPDISRKLIFEFLSEEEWKSLVCVKNFVLEPWPRVVSSYCELKLLNSAV